MSQHYSDPRREADPHALPDVETFYVSRKEANLPTNDTPTDADGDPLQSGWYYWFCLPGCLPDSDPIGPFDTEALALDDARDDDTENA